jgi:hypothetical protein
LLTQIVISYLKGLERSKEDLMEDRAISEC